MGNINRNLKLAAASVVVVGGLVAGAVAVPFEPATPMQWIGSYETLAFDTPDGKLHAGEFARQQDGKIYVFEDGTTRSWPDTDTKTKSLNGLTEVGISGKAYYDVFRDATEEVAERVTERDYKDLNKQSPRRPHKEKRHGPFSMIKTASAAITVGNTANSGVLAAVTSATFSLNNDKTDVFILVAIRDAATTSTATATYAGASATEDQTQFFDDPDGANDLRSYVFRKTGAASGTNNVVVTFSGTTDHAGVWAIAVDGLSSTGQPDSTAGDGKNNSAGLDPSITLTTVDTQTIVMGAVYSKHDVGGSSFTAASSSTSIGQLNVNGGGDRAMANYKIVSSSGSNTISWTGNGTFDDWVYSAAAYKQTADAVTDGKPIILFND